MDSLREIFLAARDIPYRIPLTITEPNHACVGKHFLMKDALERLGYEVRWAECTFSWNDLPIPKDILAIQHEEPAYHVWLEVKVDNVWQTLDATWDLPLAGVLPVNKWEQFGKMKPAVPVLTMVPYDQVVVTREPPDGYEAELQAERPFLKAFNDWLELIRNQ